MRDKTLAGLLALFFGSFGVHRFYLGETGMGCAYFLFSWTWVPFIAGIVEGIMLLTMDQATFDLRYNRTPGVTTHTVVTTYDAFGRPVVHEQHVYSETVELGAFEDPHPVRTTRTATADMPDYRGRRPRDQAERERFVLMAAKDHAGMISASELSLATQLSLREARDALEELRKQMVCDLDVDVNTGIERYVFPEFRPATPETGAERLRGEQGDTDWLDNRDVR
ncbi:MAG: TM2 domain-containing protein [Armatimonadetes bacterium]|nr:TM2 domain-containing protein [Armatimonadota bacterium]